MQGNLPVSFGKGATEKDLEWYLAGALFHSEVEAGEVTPSSTTPMHRCMHPIACSER